jgi:energy-coupling factor transport system permease protein
MLMEPPQRIDPRATLLVFLAGAAALLSTAKPFWLLGEAGIAVGIAMLCGAGRELLAALRSMLVFLVLVLVASWWEGGPLAVAPALARVVGLIAGAAALFAVAPPEPLVEALRQWGLPLRVAFVVSAGLRFIPLIAFAFCDLRDAQEARGIRFVPFWRHVRAYFALFIPLLREVFRLADQLAQALESRGFSAPSRTSVTQYRWHLSDVLLVLVSLAGCGAAIFFGR